MIVTVDGDHINVQIITEVYTAAVGPAQAGGSNSPHTHPISEINNLTQILADLTVEVAGKAETEHNHEINQVNGLPEALTDIGTQFSTLGSEIAGKAEADHNHEIADVNGLQGALDGKQAAGDYAAAAHSHTIGNVTGLQDELDGKAAASHSHTIGNVTGLQDALDAKAASSHTHTISNVTGLQDALDAKQALDADLTAIAALAPSDDDFIQRKSGVWVVRTIAQVKSDLGLDASAWKNPQWLIGNDLGAATKSVSFGMNRTEISQALTLVDAQLRLGSIRAVIGETYTGITIYQVVQGNFTGDQENKIAIATISGGTLSVVAATANDPNIWKNAATSYASIPFTSPYVATTSTLFCWMLYNNSAQTTAPTIGAFPNMFATGSNDFANSAKMAGVITGTNNSIPSSQAMSGVTANAVPIFFELY